VNRLGGAILLGIGVTAAAVAFGSRPLGVAGVGLLVAAIVARAWAGLVREPVAVDHVPEPASATEGDRVRLRIEARRSSRVPVGSVVVQGLLGRLGEYECRLRGHGRAASGTVDLGRLPRGRFPVSEARVVLGDHLGLESVTIPVPAHGASIVVHPRLVELERLFSDAGRHGGDGRRLLLRRPAALAAVEPNAVHGLAHSLGRGQTPAARAGELVVVTARLEPRAVDGLIGAAARRIVSVVWVDAPSFAGRPTRAEPGLLRLSAAGVPLAVLRRGDDLGSALDEPRVEAAARA
jgi:hypothetical protein